MRIPNPVRPYLERHNDRIRDNATDIHLHAGSRQGRQRQGRDREGGARQVKGGEAQGKSLRRLELAHEAELGEEAGREEEGAERGPHCVGEPLGCGSEEVEEADDAQGGDGGGAGGEPEECEGGGTVGGWLWAVAVIGGC